MTVLSRFAQSVYSKSVQLNAAPFRFNSIVKNAIVTQVRHGGHARVKEYRPSYLMSKRFFDHFHFYMFVLGLGPWALFAFVQAVYFGPCRLEPLPLDRVPRHWEFEDTVFGQLYQAFILPSVCEQHEVEMGLYSYYDQKFKARQKLTRVDHLIREKQNLKAWYYVPYKAEWIRRTQEQRDHWMENYESFHHHPAGPADGRFQ